MRKYSATLMDLLSDQEIKRLANHLHSKKLISDIAYDDLLTTQPLSRLDRAIKLIDGVKRSMAGDNDKEKFSIFCEILKGDNTIVMKEIVLKMEKEVGSCIQGI